MNQWKGKSLIRSVKIWLIQIIYSLFEQIYIKSIRKISGLLVEKINYSKETKSLKYETQLNTKDSTSR